MTAICIIPARFHSTRFPGKLMKKVHGKTVLQRTFENALRSPSLSAVYVATDHELIAEHIESLGGKVLWTSAGCLNGTARLIEALKKNPKLQEADLVVNVQGDHPCVSSASIEAALEILQQDPQAVMSTLAVPFKDIASFRSPHAVKCVVDLHQNALYFSRSPIPYSPRGLPKNAYHHIGLYIYRTPCLLSLFDTFPTPLQLEEDLEQLYILEQGFKIKVAFSEDPPLAVDTSQDLNVLEHHLQQIVVI
jgi:3-deoxy-manno-octulosonate cytidylyltransferase (CMP-KDO synthetase)